MGLKLIKCGSNDSGQRADKFLLKAFPKLPKSKLYSAIRKKDIKLNGKKISGGEMLETGDVFRVWLPDDILESGEERQLQKSAKPLDVVYEDENIIVIFKPKGLDVHSGASGDNCVSRLLAYLDFQPGQSLSFTPAFSSRLDRNTQGLVTAAKNAPALRELNRLVREHRIKKEYKAVLCGKMQPQKGTIIKYLSRGEGGDRVRVSDIPLEGYRKSETRYRTLSLNGELSTVEIDLITGRKHQIRAVFAHAGCPVLGDTKYGNKQMNIKYGKKSQELTAFRLTFFPEKDSPLAYLYGKRVEAEEN